MKKLLSGLLTAAILISSFAAPVLANYAAPIGEDYDIEQTPLTFEDGEATNAIDGTKAKKVTTEEEVFTLGSSNFDREFFLSMDVCYDDETNNNVTINRNGKVGPQLQYRDGKLVNELGGTDTTLGDIAANTWYTFEFEGTMTVVGANVAFRVYSYTDGVKSSEPIINAPNLGLRNFYGGTSHGSANRMLVTGASVDNIKYIAMNPNKIEITSTADEIDAGSSASLDYTMSRDEIVYTKYPVTWELYNEDNSEKLSADSGISINDSGILIADISAATQTVTVRASTVFGEKTLTETKTISIKAVDTTNEKFDSITVSGADSMKAGTSETYSVTAFKGESDVTETLTDDDVVWKIYNYNDLSPNGNTAIKIVNGTLTVDDSVLPQDIYIRAMSSSEKVYGSKKVTINWSDNQKEAVHSFDPCETESAAATVVESIDGSGAYHTTSDLNIQYSNQEGYTITSLDIRFPASGAGLLLMRRDLGKSLVQITSDGTNIKEHGGKTLTTAEADAWYHLEIAYSVGDASCNIYKYNADGTLGDRITTLGLSTWNNESHGAIRIYGNTIVDNIKITAPIPDAVTLSVPKENMFAGETLQSTANASRSSLPLKNASGLTWEALDSEGLPILGDDALVKIDQNGLLTVDAMAPAQVVKIKVSTASGQSDEKTINIQTSDIFEIKNIGVSEDEKTIEKLYVEKKVNYKDEALFIIAVHNADGVLTGVKTIQTFGDSLTTGGENQLPVDMTLPDGFNPDTDKISVMTWTMF